jgi:hypothetical protein
MLAYFILFLFSCCLIYISVLFYNFVHFYTFKLYDYISQNKVYKYTETILVKFLTYYYLTLIAFFECSIIILGCFIELIVYLIRTKKIFLILFN